ncbi:hypothetical protein [Aegicerativicinus sediminis]|uniref:hypothetical protein n=1 Tax=Aegicerativicinus sediminis TaxID=2893202 RepID=UPI001E54335A|nr:hypothetical protein [Aegicerativicinus sediminis]
MTPLISINLLLVSASQLSIVLIITSIVFAIFIGLAILKMFKLKAENKKLTEFKQEETEEKYRDFTEGHLYDNRP